MVPQGHETRLLVRGSSQSFYTYCYCCLNETVCDVKGCVKPPRISGAPNGPTKKALFIYFRPHRGFLVACLEPCSPEGASCQDFPDDPDPVPDEDQDDLETIDAQEEILWFGSTIKNRTK